MVTPTLSLALAPMVIEPLDTVSVGVMLGALVSEDGDVVGIGSLVLLVVPPSMFGASLTR